jgi:MFS family permease
VVSHVQDESLRQQITGVPVTVWVLAGGSLINRFGGFVVPFLVVALVHRGYSATVAGAAVSAYAVGKIAAGPLGGRLTDRFGAWTVTSWSMAASAATTVGLAFAGGIGVILPMAAAVGLASESYRPATSAIVVDAVPDPRRRSIAFSVYQLGVSAGATAGPVVGGLLASHGFTVLFLADAVSSALWAAFAWRARRLVPSAPSVPRACAEPPHRAHAVWRNGRMVRLVVVTLLVNLILFQSQTTMPLWVHAQGLSTSDYGLLLGLNSALVLALQLAATRLTRRWSPPTVIAVTSAVIGGGFALMSVADTPALMAVSVVVWSVGELAQWPVAASYTTRLAPAGATGRYAGARSFAYGSALLLAPLAGTAAYRASPTILWLACAGVGLVAAVVMSGRPPRPRPPLAPRDPVPSPPTTADHTSRRAATALTIRANRSSAGCSSRSGKETSATSERCPVTGR